MEWYARASTVTTAATSASMKVGHQNKRAHSGICVAAPNLNPNPNLNLNLHPHPWEED
jgi:hypothetical protein